MTTHRIAADKVVIVDDRRVKQVGGDFNPPFGDRKSLYDYSQPYKYKIVSIPVEPQPRVIKEGFFHYGNIVCSLAALESEYAHFLQDDTLILLEDWIQWASGHKKPVCLKRETSSHYLPKQMTIEPSSTMPPELDLKCEQYTVVKGLGVEEIMQMRQGNQMIDGVLHFYDKPGPTIWNWKLLTLDK